VTTERRIVAEAVQAEAALVRLDKAAERSIELCRLRWQQKRTDLIGSFSPQVRKILVAGGVLEDVGG